MREKEYKQNKPLVRGERLLLWSLGLRYQLLVGYREVSAVEAPEDVGVVEAGAPGAGQSVVDAVDRRREVENGDGAGGSEASKDLGVVLRPGGECRREDVGIGRSRGPIGGLLGDSRPTAAF